MRLIDKVVAEATGFIAVCYESKERNSMSDVRKDMWATKMGKSKVTIMPDLKILPPITKAFEQTMHSYLDGNMEVGCQVGTTNFGSTLGMR